ncbi:MAG: tetratricopeptide repeat protein [Candidatus Hydrogenedentes bacterium]|nr:tetratricopeptide repeat protein [Candidatus Hydrogenedentota bacterium]
MLEALPNERRVYFVVALGFLAVLTLAAFWPVFTLDFIRYDDTIYLTDNPHMKAGLTAEGARYALTRIVNGNYHPLTILSHQLDVSLFGFDARGHHAVNLFFHLFNVWLLFFVLGKITGSEWRSFLVAAIFAIHPLHVESVAWVSERKDVLSTFFMLLTIGAYASYARSGRRTHYVLTVLYFALALASKPMPVTLPFVLLLLDRWPLRRTLDSGPRVYLGEVPALAVEKWPLFALSAASCVITYAIQSGAGATRDLGAISFAQRIMNAVVAYGWYVWKLFVPTALAPNYPFEAVSPWLFAICFVSLAAVSLLSIVWFRAHTSLFVGWFWFLGMLVPVIGFVQIGDQAMADRYMYAPMIGLTIALVWLLPESVSRKPRRRAAGVAVIFVLAVVLCVMTNAQTHLWRNTETLFLHTLQVSPRSSVANKVLGLEYAKHGDYQTALNFFSRANEINPKDRDSAFNLGTAYLNRDRIDDAINLLQIAVDTYDKPADAHTNLGRAYLQKVQRAGASSDADEANKWSFRAKREFEQAIEIEADHTEARINLGIVLGMTGSPEEAVEVLAEAVRIAPDNADARYNYGVALLNVGKPGEASTQFKEALRLRTDYPGAAEQLSAIESGPKPN